jgi:hypothetical protein
MQMSDIKRNEDGMNLDDGQTVFFKGQLEFVKTQTYDQKLGDLKALTGLLPISSQLPAGANELVWRGFKNYGLAKFVSDYTTNFPRVDVGGTEYRRYPHEIGLSWGYNVKEVQRAFYAGFPLDARRAEACKRGIEEKLNDIAWNGDTKHNIPGFLAYPGVTTYTVPATGTGASKTWASKSADQILIDLNGMLNAISTVTMGKEAGNTILLPKAQLDYIKQTRLGTTLEKSIYTYFMENNPGVEIDWVKDLDDAGTGTTTRMVAYIKDSSHIEFEIPVRFNILEEYKEGPRSYVVPAVAETVGVIAYYPLTVVYGDGI